MTLDTWTIYHNPKCSTSRKALELLRERGVDPEVVEYLKVGWTRAGLKSLLEKMCAEPRDILRAREALVKELGLEATATTRDALLDAMIAYPVLVERPIVANSKGAVVCRPMERLDALF